MGRPKSAGEIPPFQKPKAKGWGTLVRSRREKFGCDDLLLVLLKSKDFKNSVAHPPILCRGGLKPMLSNAVITYGVKTMGKPVYVLSAGDASEVDQ